MIDVDELLDELETADVGDAVETLPSEPLALDELDGAGSVSPEDDRA